MTMFKQLFVSLYSPVHIARFRFQKIGKAIGYVFFLTFIAALPMGAYFAVSLNKTIVNASELLKDELPPFEIIDGKLVSSATEPIEIFKPGLTIVFDSTGTLTKDDVERYPNAIGLLQKEAVLVANTHAQYYSYAMLQDRQINAEDIHAFIRTVQSLLPVIIPVSFLVLYLFTSATKFVHITILAFIGLILKGTLNKRGNYRQMWTLSAYSITLSTVFFTIMESLQIVVPYAVALDWFVSITVLLLVIKELPSLKQ
ncbi:DUF1189 domain-containing protein [Thermolongibacillus altinsuensis]|nr:DUF1189 domain-containing protein [Thermolongibacillus altinsuensis]GMB07612.1 hypothetical protein B1no1_03220 [Thermolongibacillus altinsuensis]